MIKKKKLKNSNSSSKYSYVTSANLLLTFNTWGFCEFVNFLFGPQNFYCFVYSENDSRKVCFEKFCNIIHYSTIRPQNVRIHIITWDFSEKISFEISWWSKTVFFEGKKLFWKVYIKWRHMTFGIFFIY